jgi:DNA-binding transcriptional LysR family regulator
MISAIGLRHFAKVNEHGSFRAAAENLAVAPSAVSRQIMLLEEKLGAPLFERGRGRTALRLTSAGEILMRYVKTTDNELARVQSDIEALKGLRKGAIRFGVPESFTRDFVPGFLARFNQQFSRITFAVEVQGTPRLVEMLAADELDAALAFNAPLVADVKHVYERLLPTCALVPAGHPLFERETLRLSDCADYPMALPDASISAKRLYDEMFAKAKIRQRPVLVSNSYELLRQVSMQGLSIAIVNAYVTHQAGDGAGYRYIPIRDPLVKPQRMTLCIRAGRNLPTAASTFIEHLTRELESLESP